MHPRDPNLTRIILVWDRLSDNQKRKIQVKRVLSYYRYHLWRIMILMLLMGFILSITHNLLMGSIGYFIAMIWAGSLAWAYFGYKGGSAKELYLIHILPKYRIPLRITILLSSIIFVLAIPRSVIQFLLLAPLMVAISEISSDRLWLIKKSAIDSPMAIGFIAFSWLLAWVDVPGAPHLPYFFFIVVIYVLFRIISTSLGFFQSWNATFTLSNNNDVI